MTKLTRRDFLRAKKTVAQNASPAAIASPTGTRNLLTGLAPYNGPWGVDQVRHLLKRTTYGLRKTDLDTFLALTPTQAVDALLQQGVAPSPPVNDYNGPNFTDPVVPSGQTWVNAAYYPPAEPYRNQSLKVWWLNLMMAQPTTIEEKLVVFWSNHIPVQFTEVQSGALNYRYLANLRQHCMGNFRDLIRSATLDGAMLIYLNGQLNDVAAPDENYARELQELFVIGKGPNSAFTEDDVQEAARVLTGWRLNGVNYTTFFSPANHDSGPKQFSAFYGNTIIPGQAGPGAGDTELDALLDMLLATDEAALFVCRKLYHFFVYHDITQDAEDNVIAPLAQIFRSSGYEIMPVLDALFKSEHFFDALNFGAVLKSPLDFVYGYFREFGVSLPGNNLPDDRYLFGSVLLGYCAAQQQDLGDPPSVSGWPAYYQIPAYDKLWITTDTLPKRVQVADGLLYGGFNTGNFTVIFNVLDFAASLDTPNDPDLLIADIIKQIFCIPVSPTITFSLRAILLSGQANPIYWTIAWDNYASDPTNVSYRTIVDIRLKALFHFLLNMEEYQLM